MSQFRDAHVEFRDLGASLLAIGPDSIFAHKAFQRELESPFPLLSDPTHKTAEAYGVLNPGVDSRGHEGAFIRSVFVVGKEGAVRYRYISEDPAVLPDIDEVLKATRDMVAR